MPFEATWVDLENIILNELRERQIYDINYMWNLIKNYTNELIYKTETLRFENQIYGLITMLLKVKHEESDK